MTTKTLFFLLVILFSFAAQAQEPIERPGEPEEPEERMPDEPQEPPVEKIYAFADVRAQFPGGDEGMMKFVMNRIQYPKEAADSLIEGRVYVQFIVEKDGKVAQPKVIRGVHPSLDKEALRLVKTFPTWSPAKISGKKVRSYFNLPVTFRID